MLSTQDRFDILDLVARYATCVDSRDLDGLAECFTEDAGFALGELKVKGRAAIKQFFGSMPAGKGRHCNSNHVIQGDGTSATHESYIVYYSVGEKGAVVPAFLGNYKDRLTKSADGRWLIAERIATPVS